MVSRVGLRSPALGSVLNRAYGYALALQPIRHDVGGTANYKLARAGLRSGAAKVRMFSQRLDYRDDSRG